MKMSKKGSEFIQILKDAGVKECWATSEFNLEESGSQIYPPTEVVDRHLLKYPLAFN